MSSRNENSKSTIKDRQNLKKRESIRDSLLERRFFLLENFIYYNWKLIITRKKKTKEKKSYFLKADASLLQPYK
jgi:hypothetical protein